MRRATNRDDIDKAVVRISIHALHEESDPASEILWAMVKAFQSTLSMRRATPMISPKSALTCISIHALHEESDRHIKPTFQRIDHFNPRSP